MWLTPPRTRPRQVVGLDIGEKKDASPVFRRSDETGASLGRDKVEEGAREFMGNVQDGSPTRVHDDAAAASDYIGQQVPGDVDAFYHNGETHVIADRISSKRQLITGLAHEQLRHYGLRAALGDKFGQEMLKAWSNPEVRRKARELYQQGYTDLKVFDAKTRTTDADIQRAAEEAIAHLGDAGWKSSVMDRIIARVRGWLRKVAPGLEYSDAEVRNLISSAAQQVVNGRRTSLLDQAGGELAAAYMRRSEAQDWARQLDEFAKGRIPEGKPLTVGTTPKVLRLLGADKLPLTMNSDKIARVTGEDHHIPLETLKDLPRALADPYMVFESTSQARSFTVLTDLMEGGKPILAAIHLNVHEGRLDVNRVASAYGKDGIRGFLAKQELERTFLYVNKKKTSEGQRSRKLQLPREMTFRGKGRILSEKDLGNPFDEEISQGKAPAYRRVEEKYPRAKGTVDGLTVRDHVPNMDSIGASIDDYEILPGVRELRMDDFATKPQELFYAANDFDRARALAERIKESGEINPLIVVDDGHPDGPYFLEGVHRAAALNILGKKAFPAIVVNDLDRETPMFRRVVNRTSRQALVDDGIVDPSRANADWAGREIFEKPSLFRDADYRRGMKERAYQLMVDQYGVITASDFNETALPGVWH